MPETPGNLIERIDALLEAKGRSRYWLSMQISDGKSPGIVTDIARKGTMPRGDRIARMADVLGTTSEYLVGNAASAEPLRSEVGLSDRRLDWQGPAPDLPPIPLVGTGDCADLEVCAESGEMIEVERSSFDPDYHVRMIARPPALAGAADLYAIYFHGESMQPRFEPGEVGIVDPRRPVAPGDYVVVQLRENGGDAVGSVLAKRLVRRAGGKVTLEQFNPPAIFSVPVERVARMHRIVPQTELLF